MTPNAERPSFPCSLLDALVFYPADAVLAFLNQSFLVQ